MKNQKKSQEIPAGKLIKLRIDARTIITVRSESALKNWKEKYPGAVEIN